VLPQLLGFSSPLSDSMVDRVYARFCACLSSN